MIFIFLLSFIYSSENFKIHPQNDGVLIEKVVINNNYSAISLNQQNGINQICISKNNGRNFKTLYEIDFNTGKNKYVDGIGSYQNKFLIFLETGYIYRVEEDGKISDTINLDIGYIQSTSNLYAFNDNYQLAIYTNGSYYNFKDKSDTTSYKFYLSNNGFQSFQEISFDKIKYGNNNIINVKIVNNKIFINIIETRLNDEVDSSYYEHNYVIYSYSIESGILTKIFNLDYNETNQAIEDFYINKNEDIYFLISEKDNIKYTKKYLLQKLVDNELVFIEEVYNGNNNNVKPISYINNEYLLLYYSQKMMRLKVNESILEKSVFNSSLFPKSEKGIYGNLHNAIIWYDELSSNHLININQDLIYEFNLDFLFSLNSIEEINDNAKFYPNPANRGENLYIKLEDFANSIEVYDLKGNKIISVNNYSNHFELSTNDLQSGVYFVLYNFNDRKKISKLIIR